MDSSQRCLTAFWNSTRPPDSPPRRNYVRRNEAGSSVIVRARRLVWVIVAVEAVVLTAATAHAQVTSITPTGGPRNLGTIVSPALPSQTGAGTINITGGT